tara:strand:- start:208 stop:501 length:294 start_codon:yes stop_codon:yes gene_type:complete
MELLAQPMELLGAHRARRPTFSTQTLEAATCHLAHRINTAPRRGLANRGLILNQHHGQNALEVPSYLQNQSLLQVRILCAALASTVETNIVPTDSTK